MSADTGPGAVPNTTLEPVEAELLPTVQPTTLNLMSDALSVPVFCRSSVAVFVPPSLHPKIVYPIVLVKGANRRARELYQYLRSDDAWPAFETAGFQKP